MDSPPGQARGERTRQAIRTAAVALIRERGWGAITTRAIAERAEVPHGAVSHHFRGKQELLQEAAIGAIADLFAVPLELVRTAPDLATLLESTVAWYGDGSVVDPALPLLMELLRESVHDEKVRAAVAAQMRDYRDALTALLGSENGPGDPGGSDVIATLLVALMQGMMIQAMLDPGVPVAGVARATAALLGTGVGA